MRNRARLGVALACVLWASSLQAQEPPEDRVRPIRVGNLNVLLLGFGYNAHSHPTFDDNFFYNHSYQRRVLRREVRTIPIWIRLALNFTEEDRTTENTYTYWPPEVVVPYTEEVQEQTSDFGIRAELLGDLLHSRNWAVYAGGGFVIHTVSYTSRGVTSKDAAGIEITENRLAPSAAVGGRVFSAKHPYTFYGEVRYGFTYGRALGPQDADPPQVPRTSDFDVLAESSVSFEAGVGVHW
jgi:hypothetical protein